MSKAKIEPRVLKGFRDYLPEITITRSQMINTLERSFSSFGFVPIDTPALEYAEILLGKGSQETDKQLFRFTDQGGRDVAMRFDLTVPLARFVATHINELGTPFRRYHIAPVWRAEKPQRGRYREFIQCDFDIIGTKSVMADAEIVTVMTTSLTALGINHRIRLNNRQVLNGLLAGFGKQNINTPVLRAIDKLDKMGADLVRKELAEEANLSAEDIEKVFSFLGFASGSGTNAELINELRTFFAGNELALRGLDELSTITETLKKSGIDDSKLKIDLAIARGLEYYTGSVFETTFLDLPEFGSICSGGRYNDLAGLYTSKELPGVGASIGLDRIMGAFEELNRLSKRTSNARAFVTILDEGTEPSCLALAHKIRLSGVPTEVALECGKLGNQIKYASRKGIEFVVIVGKSELASSSCSVKHLASGTQEDGIAFGKLGSYLAEKLQVIS